MVFEWSHNVPCAASAFVASVVEGVEALTVILAVGSVRGWRDALYGTACALAVLTLLVLVFGTALSLVPLAALQVAVGALLLLFGLRWLRKATLRLAGVLPLHDEAAAFAKHAATLREGAPPVGFDSVAFATALNIVLLEGAEVVFIVVALGTGGSGLLLPASLGAVAALLLVVAAGLVLHRPLSRVPENAMKLIVGVMLSAFGCFWFGEGAGVAWPGADWSILALVAGFLLVALAGARLARGSSGVPAHGRAAGWRRMPRVVEEVVGMVVDDGRLALGVVVWLVALWAAQNVVGGAWTGLLLFVGLACLLLESVGRGARPQRPYFSPHGAGRHPG